MSTTWLTSAYDSMTETLGYEARLGALLWSNSTSILEYNKD
jgi:hypothetical protein